MASRPPVSGSNSKKAPASASSAPLTSWRDRYQTGSFRGVEFLTERHETEGGRRTVTHEFPQRDTPWTEDLGRRARRWSIDCFVIGPDYMSVRDNLEKALEQAGAGRLIHPFLGDKTVFVENFRLVESTDEGGMARFSIDFAEAGFTLAADVRADSNADAKAKAASAKDAAEEDFAKKFKTADRPSFVERAAAQISKRVAQASATAAKLLGGAGKLLRTVEAGIGALDGALQLVRVPIDFARSVRSTIGAVAGLGRIPLLRIRALIGIVDDIRRTPAVIGVTADREQERVNRAAIEELVTVTAVAEAVAIAADMRFGSYSEAIDLRDWLADKIDGYEVAAADAGDVIQAERLAGMRLAMIRDISGRGASLARLLSIVPRQTEPALVIANRLYGPEGIESRASDIVARNRIAHPAFLPGGIPLSVLTVPEADNGL